MELEERSEVHRMKDNDDEGLTCGGRSSLDCHVGWSVGSFVHWIDLTH